MKDKKESRILNALYDEDAKKSFIARMKSEEEEQVNLKIKIATFVVYELSKPTWSSFKDHFLSDISKKTNNTDNKEILKAESKFSNVVASYLITMESEVDYVKKALNTFTEKQKKDFWKPIVSDAFLLTGIYLNPVLESNKKNNNRIRGEQIIIKKKATPKISSLSLEIQ